VVRDSSTAREAVRRSGERSCCTSRYAIEKVLRGAFCLHSPARVIQEELLKDFSKKSEMSDWFNRVSCANRAQVSDFVSDDKQEDVAPASLMKKPNPRNVQNAAKLQELEQEVKR